MSARRLAVQFRSCGRAPSAWLVPDVAAVLEGMAAVGGTLVKRVRLQTGGAAAFGA